MDKNIKMIVDTIYLKIKPFIHIITIFLFKNNEYKNLKLQRDSNYKKQLVKLPPEIVNVEKAVINDDVEEDVKKKIEMFVKILYDKMQNVKFPFLNKNLQTLMVKNSINLVILNYIRKISLNKGITHGEYIPFKNSINIFNNENSNSLFHELLHMASSICSEYMEFCGFCQTNKKTKKSIGYGINEGYTAVLEKRYFNNEKKAYVTERDMVSKLEVIVGQSKMENMYFSANLYSLVQELKKYDNEDTVIKFIMSMDFLNKNFNREKLFNKNNIEETMIKNLNFIYSMLIKWNCMKLKFKFNKGLITEEELNNTIGQYINFFDMSIKIRDNHYEIMTVAEINNILSNVFSDGFNIDVDSKQR